MIQKYIVDTIKLTKFRFKILKLKTSLKPIKEINPKILN